MIYYLEHTEHGTMKNLIKDIKEHSYKIGDTSLVRIVFPDTYKFLKIRLEEMNSVVVYESELIEILKNA